MTNDTSPATKGDLKELRTELRDEIAGLSARIDSLEARMQTDKEEIKRHFDVVAETMLHDFLGMHRDKIESLADAQRRHEERIVRLEKSAGLVTY